MIANPEFDLEKHDPFDSRTKFGYYFSVAEPGNGGLLRFHPGGTTRSSALRGSRHTASASSKTTLPIPRASCCGLPKPHKGILLLMLKVGPNKQHMVHPLRQDLLRRSCSEHFTQISTRP